LEEQVGVKATAAAKHHNFFASKDFTCCWRLASGKDCSPLPDSSRDAGSLKTTVGTLDG